MRTTLSVILVLMITLAIAQDNPGDYMTELASNYDQINKDTWDYVRQTSRDRGANRVEKKRTELAQTLRTAKYEAGKVKSYLGDNSLKLAYVNYLNLTYLLINDNYKQIVDMERIAEESYDDMEAYLQMKEQVNAKMDSASEVLNRAQTEFANKYAIRLTSDDSRISKKLNAYGRLNSYYNKVYLLFYKSYFYEGKMLNAIALDNIGDMEQYRQTLEITSKEGMEAMVKIAAFNGNEDFKNACYKMLEFYYGEAVRYMPGQIEFFSTKDRMDTMAKNFQSKKKPSQQEVKEYNDMIVEYNSSIAGFNETNEYLNKYRSKRHEALNKAIEDFYNANL